MLFLNHNSQFFPFLNSKSFYFLRKKRKRVLHGRTATEKGTIAYELMLLPHIYNNAPHFVRTALLLIFEVCEPTFVLDDWGKQRLIKRASAFLSPYLFPWKVCLGSTTTRVPPLFSASAVRYVHLFTIDFMGLHRLLQPLTSLISLGSSCSATNFFFSGAFFCSLDAIHKFVAVSTQ
jgi:hypothetical protein